MIFFLKLYFMQHKAFSESEMILNVTLCVFYEFVVIQNSALRRYHSSKTTLSKGFPQ
jgi:hypothetical protein